MLPLTVSIALPLGALGSEALHEAHATDHALVSAITALGEFRSFDGSGNNLAHPEWGAAHRPFVRWLPNDYLDGLGEPAGAGRPSARAISNAVAHQASDRPCHLPVTDMLWQWGQFLDHDIAETPLDEEDLHLPIRVPLGDPWFDPQGEGGVSLPFSRSAAEFQDGVREQINGITAWVDGSMVYGSDMERARALRAWDGLGRLATSDGDQLPLNVLGLPNAPSSEAPNFFLAGDIRANEQVGLTAMHTLFVREHNTLCEALAQRFPGASGEQLYQAARLLVGAQIQRITYEEFLPALLGARALSPYLGYDPNVDGTIANEFAVAAYRLGHTFLSNELLLEPSADGVTSISLADAFFSPSTYLDLGIEPILGGLVRQRPQELDPLLVDGVRNFLFGPPGAGGLDLAALNIQRGRDHGVPGYAALRSMVGLEAVTDVEQIAWRQALADGLQASYASVGEIDAWVGLLAEVPADDALVGQTLGRLLVRQFEALRDGDRFWYERSLSPAALAWVQGQNLASVIERNTDLDVQADVFHLP